MSRANELFEKIPKVEVYQPNLDEFYKFMYQRHVIYVKRFIKKLPPPWTDNPILRDYKFTNIYRELDRGTQYYINTVAPMAYSLLRLLWLTVMYRLLNRVETFVQAGLPSYGEWEERKESWKAALYLVKEQQGQVFTNAHLTVPVNEIGKSKVERYVEVMDEIHKLLPDIVGWIRHADQLEKVFNLLKELPCVGSFISYEICCDLMLVKAIRFSENDWANAGPGCKTGIRLIFPKVEKKPEEYLYRIRLLQKEQQKHFRRLKITFPYLYKDALGKPVLLTLRSIEHSLCEFSKYQKMKTGIGKQRMYFKPVTGQDPRGKQMIMRFPREAE